MIVLWQLFVSYLKIGFFGFGGGYAMLSLIQNEVVVQHGWMTNAQFADIVAVSQITPGPIAINSATYVGYTVGLQTGHDGALTHGRPGQHGGEPHRIEVEHQKGVALPEQGGAAGQHLADMALQHPLLPLGTASVGRRVEDDAVVAVSRRTSRRTNLSASSTIQRTPSSRLASIFSRAQVTTCFTESTCVVSAPAARAASVAPPV